MWYLAYNILLILASPVILLILLAKKRCRHGLAQRLGFLPKEFLQRRHRESRPVLWVHAVSLGEVVAVVPLVRELRRRCPECRLVISTVTETGREAVEQRLGGMAEHCYAPLDFPWVVARVVDGLRPQGFLFVETELWPNLLRTLSSRGVPAILINGRLSSRSFARYQLIGAFMKRVLETLALCLMQSERDVERIIALGAPPSCVVRTGNIKFDQPLPDKPGGRETPSRSALGLAEGEQLIVAGSTHPGEEEQLLACYEKLCGEFPSLVLLLAPRHIERAAEVEAVVRQRGLTAVRRSILGQNEKERAHEGGARVIILDTRGELATVYRYAVLSYVGGTLVPVGGHNLLEPAQWGKPVFFGPHTDHCAEVAELLLRAGGAGLVQDGNELAGQMTKLLRDPSALQKMGDAAQQVLSENRGAIGRSLDLIGKVLVRNDERGMMNDECRGTDSKSRPGSFDCGPLHSSFSIHHSSFLRRPLEALAFPYGLAVQARAILYRKGWLPRRRLSCRVISVGNLTVGGTGKTPVVIWLVEWLLARGLRIGVLSRGYKRDSRDEFLLVSDGKAVLAGPAEAGDEPHLIARRCIKAVVAVGADRYRLGRWVQDQLLQGRGQEIDCFVLDDGFQHLALHRDVDVLLVDASEPGGLEALLPAGRLREPLSAAARATVLLLTRADQAGDLSTVQTLIKTATGRLDNPILVRFRAEGFVDLWSGITHELGWAKGRKALIFSGIGNSLSFRRTVTEVGVAVLDEVALRDHHRYQASDVAMVRERANRCGAEMILTTEKDAGKVARLLDGPDQVFAVRLGTEIMEGQARLERLALGNDER